MTHVKDLEIRKSSFLSGLAVSMLAGHSLGFHILSRKHEFRGSRKSFEYRNQLVVNWDFSAIFILQTCIWPNRYNPQIEINILPFKFKHFTDSHSSHYQRGCQWIKTWRIAFQVKFAFL